jgi:arylsulfatase A-like enzyme
LDRIRGRALLWSVLTLCAAGAVALFLLWERHASESVPRFPGASLIFISIDTLRRDAVSVYNGKRESTPHLDDIAKECVVFDDAIAASNNTGPSHASMFTGVSAAVHGVLNTQKKAPQLIPRTLPTIAERLKERGYKTFARADGGYLASFLGFNRGFDSFDSTYNGLTRKIPAFLAWLDELKNREPFFAFLHTYEVHSPYISNRQRFEAALRGFEETEVARRVRMIANSADWLETGNSLFTDWRRSFTSDDFRALHSLYAACVEMMDANIGLLYNELKSRGVLDRAMVVFVSDHGEQFGEHGDVQHEEAYDELLRVPLLVRLPGAAMGGTVVKRSFSAIHLMPTLLDWLGLPAPTMIEGKSQLEFLNVPATGDEAVFAHRTCQDMFLGDVARTQRWKIFDFEGHPLGKRIFHLEVDPGEKENLAASAPAGAKHLEELLDIEHSVWKALSEKYDAGRASGETEKSTFDQLKGLGYVR